MRSETYLLEDNTYIRKDSVWLADLGYWDKTDITVQSVKLAKNKLENQPEFFGNVALGYDIGGFSGRISMFYNSEFPILYSADGRSDSYQSAYTRFDLLLKQKVTDNISLILSINNLTNTEESTYTKNTHSGWKLISSKQKYGMSGDFGVRMDL